KNEASGRIRTVEQPSKEKSRKNCNPAHNLPRFGHRKLLIMASLLRFNPMVEFSRGGVALQVNLVAAKGLLEIMRTNLGPKGTMKMFVLFIYFGGVHSNQSSNSVNDC
ncbi:hypothetical protein D917_07510, partial [Trichinella nativa]